MSFILGNEAVLSAFEAVSKTGHHSHAYIIEGPEGSGKLTLARAIAATMVCPKEKPCFSCPGCRRIMEGVHQDVREIRCLDGESVIKIEAIREMIAEAYIKPAECDKKIFIVDGAQKTKTETQNALLQIFEEPPKNVVIFLLVPNRNLLLSTLKSRAVALKTELFSAEFLKDELLRRYPDGKDAVDEAVLLADGVLGRALAFMDSEENRSAVTLVRDYFSLLTKPASYASLSSVLVSGIGSDKAKLFSVMESFANALRDILTFASGYTEKRLFFADREMLEKLSERLDSRTLIASYDTVCRIIRDYTKINVPLALASISMSLSDDLS